MRYTHTLSHTHTHTHPHAHTQGTHHLISSNEIVNIDFVCERFVEQRNFISNVLERAKLVVPVLPTHDGTYVRTPVSNASQSVSNVSQSDSNVFAQ